MIFSFEKLIKKKIWYRRIQSRHLLSTFWSGSAYWESKWLLPSVETARFGPFHLFNQPNVFHATFSQTGNKMESFHKVHNSSFQSEIHWSLVVLDMLLLIVTIHASLLQHTVHWDAVRQYDNNGIIDAYSIAGITDCHCHCAIWLKCFCIYGLKFSKALTGTGWDAIGLDECSSAEHRAFHLS